MQHEKGSALDQIKEWSNPPSVTQIRLNNALRENRKVVYYVAMTHHA